MCFSVLIPFSHRSLFIILLHQWSITYPSLLITRIDLHCTTSISDIDLFPLILSNILWDLGVHLSSLFFLCLNSSSLHTFLLPFHFLYTVVLLDECWWYIAYLLFIPLPFPFDHCISTFTLSIISPSTTQPCHSQHLYITLYHEIFLSFSNSAPIYFQFYYLLPQSVHSVNLFVPQKSSKSSSCQRHLEFLSFTDWFLHDYSVNITFISIENIGSLCLFKAHRLPSNFHIPPLLIYWTSSSSSLFSSSHNKHLVSVWNFFRSFLNIRNKWTWKKILCTMFDLDLFLKIKFAIHYYSANKLSFHFISFFFSPALFLPWSSPFFFIFFCFRQFMCFLSSRSPLPFFPPLFLLLLFVFFF